MAAPRLHDHGNVVRMRGSIAQLRMDDHQPIAVKKRDIGVPNNHGPARVQRDRLVSVAAQPIILDMPRADIKLYRLSPAQRCGAAVVVEPNAIWSFGRIIAELQGLAR